MQDLSGMSKIRVAVAVVSALTFTTRIAAADDQASPQQLYKPAPAPAPHQPLEGAPAGAPPGNGPPGNRPPGNRPPGYTRPIADPIAVRDEWQPALYIEPSIGITSGTLSSVPAPVGPSLPHNAGRANLQLAIGVLWRERVGATMPWRIHAGLVASEAELRPPGSSSSFTGIGVESEVDRPITREVRTGARISIERRDQSVNLVTLGARVHVHELVWVGVDAFYLTRPRGVAPSCSDEVVPDCTAGATGVMANLGVEGKAGAIVGIGGVTLAAIVIAIALANFHVPD